MLGPPRVRLYWRQRQQSRIAFLKWSDASGVHQESTRQTDPRLATHCLHLKQIQLIERHYGRTQPSQAPPTLEVVLDAYRRRLTEGRVSDHHREVQRKRLDDLQTYFSASTPAQDLTTERVDHYISARYAQKVSPTTIRHELVALRAAYNQAVADHLLSEIPFHVTLPKARKREGTVPSAHLSLILTRCIPSHLADRAIYLAAYTSLRRGDILRLQWQQFDWDALVLVLTTSKRQKAVRIPIHPNLAAFLKPVRALAGPVVPMSPNSSGNVHRRTRELCGTAYGLHTLRHTFLTALMSAGVHPRIMADLAGNTPEVALAHYSHPGDADLRKAVNLLPFPPK